MILSKTTTTVLSAKDAAMMHRIEKYITQYPGNDLMHDIELNFPGASYRAFFLAVRRTYGDIDGRLAILGEQEREMVQR